MIRVVLPAPLKALAGIEGEVIIALENDATQRLVFDAIEARYPMLRGTLRDHTTQRRRAFLRLYACERDLSHQSPDDQLPATVRSGDEPLLIIGAMAGG